MDLQEVQRLADAGESETVEFKKSTAQLPRAGETLCGMLNGTGGRVLIGVTKDGGIVGQQVADTIQQDVAAMLQRFEPPAPIALGFVALPDSDRKVVVLQAPPVADSRPFTFHGRPYQRVGTSTSAMPQDHYESLLLERAHARRRWENQPAVGVRLEDLDREEILQTREAAVQHRRISAGTSRDAGEILDRLGLRRDGVITQAAMMLYGTKFLPDYPQAMLKLGRFRGTTVTGDILDNKQEHFHAFAIVREAMAFLDRTLPLAAHFVEGRIQREDRLPVPPDALREILLNAVMHRDYADPGGYVAVAVFDDRIEIRSVGRLPSGITPAMLSRPHRSIPRNPLIAEAFHRTGAVEVWGRGTNRVIEECKRYRVRRPTFEEVSGAVVVTFRARIRPGAEEEHQVSTRSALSRHQVQVLEKAKSPTPLKHLLQLCGRTDRTKFRGQVLRPLLDAGLLEMSVPDKPTSSRQQYRTTPAGTRLLNRRRPQ